MARSPDLTVDEQIDIARLVAIRRNRRMIGYGFAPKRHARPVPERDLRVIRRRAGVHDFTPGYLAVEAELVERLLSDALARMDSRDRQRAKAVRRRHRRRQRAWMAGSWTGV